MELRAVIEALKMTSEDDVVELRSDSAYVINGILDKWYLNWFISGRNSTGARASNLDLWHELVDELARHVKVYPVHVRGHRGEEFQEQVDALAGRGSAEALIKFKEMAGNV
jgi:ribonuclease HI